MKNVDNSKKGLMLCRFTWLSDWSMPPMVGLGRSFKKRYSSKLEEHWVEVVEDDVLKNLHEQVAEMLCKRDKCRRTKEICEEDCRKRVQATLKIVAWQGEEFLFWEGEQKRECWFRAKASTVKRTMCNNTKWRWRCQSFMEV